VVQPAGEEKRPVFDVRRLEVGLGGRPVLGPLDLQVAPGAFLGILGPNGSGKTTLLRALGGVVSPSAGEALLLGKPVAQYRTTELARLVGVVPQQFSLEFDFTVSEMVAMGRYAHGGRHPEVSREMLQAAGTAEPGVAGEATQTLPSRQDREPNLSPEEAAVATALQQTGLTALADRMVTQLSGGERQRALIAQTLAQETPILLLDEPLNNLDLNHQLEVMQLLSRLHKAGRTIVVVLHDLNIAAQYCERLVLLDGGRVAADGGPTEILDPTVILEVFRVRVAVHRQGARPYLTPLWSKAHQALVEGEAAKVHVMAGGGAASAIVEELVLHGFAPTVGVVSVFDTDYLTAERYELEVVSAPPFQPFPPDAVEQMEAMVRDSDVLVVAPVFFAPGNMELLRAALDAARRGLPVVFLDAGSIEQRDLAGGEAAALLRESLAAGAATAASAEEVVEIVRRVMVRRAGQPA
jgi:iron complex transport system ATP-binding protein